MEAEATRARDGVPVRAAAGGRGLGRAGSLVMVLFG